MEIVDKRKHVKKHLVWAPVELVTKGDHVSLYHLEDFQKPVIIGVNYQRTPADDKPSDLTDLINGKIKKLNAKLVIEDDSD